MKINFHVSEEKKFIFSNLCDENFFCRRFFFSERRKKYLIKKFLWCEIFSPQLLSIDSPARNSFAPHHRLAGQLRPVPPSEWRGESGKPLPDTPIPTHYSEFPLENGDPFGELRTGAGWCQRGWQWKRQAILARAAKKWCSRHCPQNP